MELEVWYQEDCFILWTSSILIFIYHWFYIKNSSLIDRRIQSSLDHRESDKSFRSGPRNSSGFARRSVRNKFCKLKVSQPTSREGCFIKKMGGNCFNLKHNSWITENWHVGTYHQCILTNDWNFYISNQYKLLKEDERGAGISLIHLLVGTHNT